MKTKKCPHLICCSGENQQVFLRTWSYTENALKVLFIFFGLPYITEEVNMRGIYR